MTTDAKVQIGNSADFLEGTSVDTPAGLNLFREGVVISDPELPGARAEVRQIGTALTDMDWGLVTHSIIQGRTTGGGGSLVDVKVTPSGALTVEADVVGTVAVSGTVQIAEPVSVENTTATPLFVLDANMHGTWGYTAGTTGTASIPANAKIFQISAVAGITAASFTINGGSTITIPANQSLTIEPRGLLISPTVVFTNTTSYFIEYAV